MREYKFRGRRVDNGEWVYGYFVRKEQRHAKRGITLDSFIVTEQNIQYEVDPETVGQYTGLRDKNGKEIYEGDIIKLCDTNPLIMRVEIILAWYGYKTVFRYVDDGKEVRNAFLDKCEVIGNIYENPELLSGANKCTST